MEEKVPKEENEDVTLVTSFLTMKENALIEGNLPEMMTTTSSGGKGIKGTTGSKERGRLPMIKVEMGNLSRGQ